MTRPDEKIASPMALAKVRSDETSTVRVEIVRVAAETGGSEAGRDGDMGVELEAGEFLQFSRDPAAS